MNAYNNDENPLKIIENYDLKDMSRLRSWGLNPLFEKHYFHNVSMSHNLETRE